jgi:hypothetical protein
MQTCVGIVITQDLGLLVPPEIYAIPGRARREAHRWAIALSGRSLDVDPMPVRVRLAGDLHMHVVELSLEPGWSACPLWMQVRVSRRSLSSLGAKLMPADDDEARNWFMRTTRRRISPSMGIPGMSYETRLTSHHVERYVGIHFAKRIGSWDPPATWIS